MHAANSNAPDRQTIAQRKGIRPGTRVRHLEGWTGIVTEVHRNGYGVTVKRDHQTMASDVDWLERREPETVGLSVVTNLHNALMVAEVMMDTAMEGVRLARLRLLQEPSAQARRKLHAAQKVAGQALADYVRASDDFTRVDRRWNAVYRLQVRADERAARRAAAE